MSVHISQYRPGFVESDEALYQADISAASELLAIEFIERWIKMPLFERFCISHPYREYPRYHHLIAEFKDDRHWVVALLDGEPDEDLFKYFPKWMPKP
jgi:hypothetical protein